MSLMELFSNNVKGNTGNADTKTGVTALGHATQGGNTDNTGNPQNLVIEKRSNKVEWVEIPEFTPGALIVTCYTPAGNPVEVEANNPGHAEFLLRMNPKPDI